MQVDHDLSKGQAPASDLGDELLRCRMVIIGLHSGAIERDQSAAFEKLREHCLNCLHRTPCAVDLRRDPTNQVWEAYCPNSGALNSLVAQVEASN